MSEKSWKLTEKEHQKMQDMQNNMFGYYKYVSDQRESFIRIMLFINDIINELKHNGKISEYTEFRARIKSLKSAMGNDESKTLDDVFGMEIITAIEEEIEIIKQEIEKNMNINENRSKKLNKPNGYKAGHRMVTLKKEKTSLLGLENEEYERIPQIEIQYKTIEVAIRAAEGTASHTAYKGESMEEIQNKYDNNKFDIFELPDMWISDKERMRSLNKNEILKKMYPFLKINKERGEEK